MRRLARIGWACNYKKGDGQVKYYGNGNSF